MNLTEFQTHLNYRFKDQRWLINAITRPAAVPTATAASSETYLSFNSLKFLGNKIYGLVLANISFHVLASAPPGELTERLNNFTNLERIAKTKIATKLPEIIIAGYDEPPTAKTSINSKADHFHALIGAIWQDAGTNRFTLLSELIIQYLHPGSIDSKAILTDLKSRSKPKDSPIGMTDHGPLTTQWGHTFTHSALLHEALTRTSAVGEGIVATTHETPARDFQRLEFLGDRVLGAYVATQLCQRTPTASIAKLQDHFVTATRNGDLLETIAISINLGANIIMGLGETHALLELNPKVLSDHLEALIGATWLDTNWDFNEVTETMDRHWQPHFALSASVSTGAESAAASGAGAAASGAGTGAEYSSGSDSDERRDKTLATDLSTLRLKRLKAGIITPDKKSSSESAAYAFRRKLLAIEVSDCTKPATIPDWPETFANEAKYNQFFEAMIIAEARAVINQSIEEIEKGRHNWQDLTLKKSAKFPKRLGNPIELSVTNLLDLPEDCPPQSLAMILTNSRGNQCIALGFCTTKKDSAPTSGAGAYADGAGDPAETYIIRLTNPAFVGTLRTSSIPTDLKVHVAGSLIPHERMYSVCKRNVTKSAIMKQIYRATLPPWPKVTTVDGRKEKTLAHLNAVQRAAVKGFIHADPGLYLLQGPPGTGKTTTIVTLIRQMVNRRKRLLVCAPSNKAIQVIAMRLLESQSRAANQCLIAMAGAESMEEKIPHDLRPLLIHNWDSYITRELSINVSKYSATKISLALNHPQSKGLAQHISHLQKILKTRIQPKLRLIYAYFPHLELEGSISELDDNIANLLEQLSDHPSFADEFKHTVSTRSGAGDIPELSEAAKNYQKLYTATQIILNRIVLTIQASGDIRKHMLLMADVVFATLIAAGRPSFQHLIKSCRFDSVVIDEASQAPEVAALMPLAHAHAEQKCLLVGDPRQLPAIVLAQEVKNKNLDQSLMQRLIDEHRQPFVMLNIQYRMHPEIRFFPSNRYYGGKLIDDASIAKRLNPCPTLRPYVFVNLRDSVETPHGTSYINLKEVNAIVRAVRKIKNTLKIGIISFYAAQIAEIKAQLEAKKLARPDVQVSTVDGFQGSERDVILISFVRANAKGELGFTRRAQRLNVALTRAKYALIMFGNFARLTHRDSEIKILLNEAKDRSLVLSSLRMFLSQFNAKATRPPTDQGRGRGRVTTAVTDTVTRGRGRGHGRARGRGRGRGGAAASTM